MPLEIRTITDDEIPAWYDAVLLGFHAQPVPGLGDWARPTVELDRTRGVLDQGRFVATLRSITGELTVPGAVVPAGLLTQVTVQPTHRRQGLLTRLVDDDLHDARDRGELVSFLVAAEYPIYGRFGYGPVADQVTLTLDASAIRFLPAVTADAGADADHLGADAWCAAGAALYDERRSAQPGWTSAPDRWWQSAAGVAGRPGSTDPPPRLVVLQRHGHTAGVAAYTVTDRWEQGRPRATCDVQVLVGRTPLDEARLWRFCCELDWVTTVTARLRSPGDPLRWFVEDARMVAEGERFDFTWLRIVSPRALAARRYRTAGALTLGVHDRQRILPAAVRLDADADGVATCAPTSAPPDLRLDAGDLAVLAMGAVPAGRLAAVGRIEELTPGAVDLADRLFAWPVPPSTVFAF